MKALWICINFNAFKLHSTTLNFHLNFLFTHTPCREIVSYKNLAFQHKMNELKMIMMMMMMIFPDNTIKYNFFLWVVVVEVVSEFLDDDIEHFFIFLSIYRSKHFWRYFFMYRQCNIENYFNSSPSLFLRNTLKQRIFIGKKITPCSSLNSSCIINTDVQH